jgi:hypothetical protein
MKNKRLKTHNFLYQKTLVNENRSFGSKIRDKIGFFGGEKETWGGERNLLIHIALLKN